MKNIFFIYASGILLLIAAINVEAQEPCGTDAVHQYKMQTDSVYRKHFLDFQSGIHTILQNNSGRELSAVVYSIPVVFHVIHLGEPIGTGTNIPDVQILQTLDGVNDRFRDIIGSGLDIEINFCLAASDADGHPTTGINRVDGSMIPQYSAYGIELPGCGSGAIENDIKDLSRWPVSLYYNIWVVNKICNGQWGGYAYYPWGDVYDGAVIARNAMGYASSTVTHELGHGFALAHTFEGDGGGTQCPVNSNCALDGDGICDTPPHKQGDCGSSNPCTGSGVWDNSRYNYMSYCNVSSATGRFTQDQKNALRASLATFPREDLLYSLGCVPDVGVVENNPDNLQIHVYPNPTSGLFSLEIILPEEISLFNGVRVRIQSLTGSNLIYSSKINRIESMHTDIIDMSGFSKGVYVLEVITDKSVFNARVIVE